MPEDGYGEAATQTAVLNAPYNPDGTAFKKLGLKEERILGYCAEGMCLEKMKATEAGNGFSAKSVDVYLSILRKDGYVSKGSRWKRGNPIKLTKNGKEYLGISSEDIETSEGKKLINDSKPGKSSKGKIKRKVIPVSYIRDDNVPSRLLISLLYAAGELSTIEANRLDKDMGTGYRNIGAYLPYYEETGYISLQKQEKSDGKKIIAKINEMGKNVLKENRIPEEFLSKVSQHRADLVAKYRELMEEIDKGCMAGDSLAKRILKYASKRLSRKQIQETEGCQTKEEKHLLRAEISEAFSSGKIGKAYLNDNDYYIFPTEIGRKYFDYEGKELTLRKRIIIYAMKELEKQDILDIEACGKVSVTSTKGSVSDCVSRGLIEKISTGDEDNPDDYSLTITDEGKKYLEKVPQRMIDDISERIAEYFEKKNSHEIYPEILGRTRPDIANSFPLLIKIKEEPAPDYDISALPGIYDIGGFDGLRKPAEKKPALKIPDPPKPKTRYISQKILQNKEFYQVSSTRRVGKRLVIMPRDTDDPKKISDKDYKFDVETFTRTLIYDEKITPNGISCMNAFSLFVAKDKLSARKRIEDDYLANEDDLIRNGLIEVSSGSTVVTEKGEELIGFLIKAGKY